MLSADALSCLRRRGTRACYGSANMNEYGASDDHRPLTWWRGHPIYATHFVVIVFVASLLVTSILLTANQGGLLNWLVFDSSLVLRGQIWRVLTYGLVNGPSINFALDMLMIVWFGREVEKTFGLKSFLVLFGLIYFTSPVVLTLFGPILPSGLAGERGALALFVAFATLFPNVPVFFQLLAKWAALILVGIFVLIYLSSHDAPELISLLSTVGIAHVFARHQQGRFAFPRISLFQRKPKLRVLPDLPKPRKMNTTSPIADSSSMAEVDALLDKIAQSGISSLTPAERAKLDAARDDLKRRGPGRR